MGMWRNFRMKKYLFDQVFHPDDFDLVSKALQGRQLQPPLYSFMTKLNLESDTVGVGLSMSPIRSVVFRYLCPMQEESVHSASFSGATWKTATGEQLKCTIHSWIQGIRDGKFFILVLTGFSFTFC